MGSELFASVMWIAQDETPDWPAAREKAAEDSTGHRTGGGARVLTWAGARTGRESEHRDERQDEGGFGDRHGSLRIAWVCRYIA